MDNFDYKGYLKSNRLKEVSSSEKSYPDVRDVPITPPSPEDLEKFQKESNLRYEIWKKLKDYIDGLRDLAHDSDVFKGDDLDVDEWFNEVVMAAVNGKYHT